jgi:hypothetical protein
MSGRLVARVSEAFSARLTPVVWDALLVRSLLDDGDFGALAEADDETGGEGGNGDDDVGSDFSVELDGFLPELAAGFSAACGEAEMDEELGQANLQGTGQTGWADKVGESDGDFFEVFGGFFLLEHASPVFVGAEGCGLVVEIANDGAGEALLGFHGVKLAGGDFGV